MTAPRRLSAVTVLVAVVLLLVPALAWLQYRWVGQVSEAERERMQRTLRTAAAQFANDFDTELSRAVAGLQVDGSIAREENWATYAQRYTTWTQRTADPRLVREVLLVDAIPDDTGDDGRGDARNDRRHRHRDRDISADDLRVRRWNEDQRIFAAAEWTPELAPMRAPLAEHFGEVQVLRGQATGRFRREGTLSFTVGDPYTLVAPVTVFDFPSDRRSPPRIDILGFTLVRLDPSYVTQTMLPALTTKHFHGEDGTADYRLAVTDRHDAARVIWESDAGAAEAIGTSPDVDATFMSARPDQVFMISRNRGQVPPPPGVGAPEERIVISVLQDRRQPAEQGTTPEARVPSPPPPAPPAPRTLGVGGFEGRWRVAAVHRAGSLEAAVAAVRIRNLMLSSGILLLLSTAIGLIVVSARRAQTLARQQMEFVAAVSHELRTPVSVIGTAASNLADGVVADPSRVRKYGETIQGEARRLAETVERVLQLAGIAAGSAARSKAPVHVGEVIQQSVAACRPEIDSRGVTLELSVADDLPSVQGDAGALRSAVQNLVSNAVKYGGDARWVRISANRSEAAPARVVITVADRGLGIAPEDRKHIFEPFYRGREAVSRQIQGSGLGLNLVARIAEAHGGSVQVTSEPGKGSSFALILPAAPGSPAGVGVALLPTQVDAK
jgi:signal transduction histidine kinase